MLSERNMLCPPALPTAACRAQGIAGSASEVAGRPIRNATLLLNYYESF